MALTAASVIEMRSTGASTNSGAFDVTATFATDLAATVANTASPVVTSATYTFVAGDVGSYVFISTGTNWIPGFYPIASVSAGAATLNAAIGAAYLFGGATVLNTVAGCATVASPTAGTWGCDYSQQNSAKYTFTDLVIDGTTNTKFTSAAFPVGPNFVGNSINVTSGTGFTVQRLIISSVSGTTATCNASLGTLSSTGGNAKLGGALDSLSTLNAALVGSNKVFVQTSGGYSVGATNTFAQAAIPTNVTTPTQIIGYTTYRGDNGKATFTTTATSVIAIKLTGTGFILRNLVVDCASFATTRGIDVSGNYNRVINCVVKNFTAYGIILEGGGDSCLCESCEVTGGTSAATAGLALVNGNAEAFKCNVHDNACTGMTLQGVGMSIEDCIIANNTGASSHGISIVASYGYRIKRNTIHKNGSCGISSTSQYVIACHVKGNIFSENVSAGMKLVTSSGTSADAFYSGNAYYSNGTNRVNVDDVSGQNGVVPHVNTSDVILSADPYTNKATNDFTLNNTAGGGAACRAAGYPTSWPGFTITGYPDMGAVQHQDAGAAGILVAPGMGGW